MPKPLRPLLTIGPVFGGGKCGATGMALKQS